MQKWRETQGGSTQIPDNCVPKTERSGNSGIPQQISASFPSLCSRALTSFPTRGGLRHSQNSWVKYKLAKACAYTHSASISYIGLGTLLRLPVSTWHKTSRGFPSVCSTRDEAPEWVYWKCYGCMALGVFLPL